MTVSPKGKEWQDRWWELRMLVKPRLCNPTSPISYKRWHKIKNMLKDRLEKEGLEGALKLADFYEKKYSAQIK